MSYDVLVTGRHVPERLGGFLAELFDVPSGRVFVGAMSEMENWDKAAVDRSFVSCTYESRSGALAWYLSIYADPAAVPRQPLEAQLSRRLSAELDTVTAFPEGTRIPDGSCRRAFRGRGPDHALSLPRCRALLPC